MYVKALAKRLMDGRNPITTANSKENNNSKEKGEKEELDDNNSQISELAPKAPDTVSCVLLISTVLQGHQITSAYFAY